MLATLASRRHPRRGVNAPWLYAAFLVQRKFPAEKEVLRFDGSSRSYGQRKQTDEVGQQSKDDLNENDHAAIMTQLRQSRTAGSVRPASNICGGQAFSAEKLLRIYYAERKGHQTGDLSA